MNQRVVQLIQHLRAALICIVNIVGFLESEREWVAFPENDLGSGSFVTYRLIPMTASWTVLERPWCIIIKGREISSDQLLGFEIANCAINSRSDTDRNGLFNC